MANITLGSSAASVTFSSISQAYRDLVLVISAKGTGNMNLVLQLNGDTGTNYSYVFMYGNGSTASSGNDNTETYGRFVTTSTVTTAEFTPYILNFMDYSSTDKHKTFLSRSNNAGLSVEAFATRWANTSAITSIKLMSSGANSYAAGSSFALYGVAA
jgi:hypothetical protein